ncbi:MAG: hypothetical protein RMJ15_00670 [Nitrososphaerota archaeon]|nr:hypothetical protein [Nitrososphaerota archaeon]
MAHITIEYVITLPILILQIILFPLTASWLMNVWVDSRRSLALEEAADHLGSTIQQVYFTLNHMTVQELSFVQRPDVPKFIEDIPYIGNGTLKTVDPSPGSAKVLELTFRLAGTKIVVKTSVLLGQNAEWTETSTFISNSTDACIRAWKFPNGTIRLQFGG